jgi:glutamate transport system substrate-binding protein
MRNRLAAAVMATALALTPAACHSSTPVSFQPGTTMDRLHRAGKITIGVKADQPSLGFRNPATGHYEGFDIDIAVMVADELGLTRDQIHFEETTSNNRQTYLIKGLVDIVIASYSITDDRRQTVGQAGPYYITGQQLLVRRADAGKITGPDDVVASHVCSVSGSTPLKNWQHRYGGPPIAEPTYTDCVRRLLGGSVDAVTSDGAVLLGYAAQLPTKLAVVGAPFSKEPYGIGYRKGDRPFCEFLTGVIQRLENDGRWDRAFAETLGKAGAPAPAKPRPEPCQA